MLPQRKKPLRSGIERAPKRIWNRHRRFVRSHECVCSLCALAPGDECEGKVQFAHVSSAANSGKGLKAFDWFAVPACAKHHRWQHDHGAESFQKRYGIDLWKLAAEFAAKSPDTAMREAMRSAA